MLMSRAAAIRQLYRGGQAAILAEILVIVALIIYGTMLYVSGQNIAAPNRAINAQALGALVDEYEIAYQAGSIFFFVLPTMVMIIVIWSWHAYLTSEGVLVAHWLISSLGLLGVGLLLVAGGVNSVSLVTVNGAIQNGDLPEEARLITLIIIFGVYLAGVSTLYLLYPLGVLLVAWQHKLYQRRWLLLGFVIFILFNGTSLMVLSPFALGVMMLIKAQHLAQTMTTTDSRTAKTL